MKNPAPLSDYTFWRALRFYIPLAIQGISQSLTYPLVASVISHGKFGTPGFGAFAQGQAVFFLLFSLGYGLITTGMVYAKTKAGFDQFWRLTLYTITAICVLQFLICIPPFSGIVFDHLLALDPELRFIARDSLLYTIPAMIMLHLRSPYLAILYNGRASAAANFATLGRIALTLTLSYVFVSVGFVGHFAGIISLTLPIAAEWRVARLMAAKLLAKLPPGELEAAPVRELLLFTIPLSVGGLLINFSGFMVAAFISRVPDALRILPVHYIVMGIVGPLNNGAGRMQAVALAFPPPDRRASQTFRFSCVAGAIMAGLAFIINRPQLANWYFGQVQNLPPSDIPLAVNAMLLAALIPFIQAIRGHAEGLAAWLKRPNAILAGQSVYLAILVCLLFFFLQLGFPGHLMGAAAMMLAGLASFATIRMGLMWTYFEERSLEPIQRRDTEIRS